MTTAGQPFAYSTIADPEGARERSREHAPDAASLLKTAVLLFLPLSFLPALLSRLGVSMGDLRSFRGPYAWLYFGLPALGHVRGDYSGFGPLLAGLLAALAGFHLIVPRWRKRYLAALACGYAGYVLGPVYLAAFLLAAALIWLGVLRYRPAPLRVAFVAAGVALVLAQALLGPYGALEHGMALLSCLMLALRAYSLAQDVETTGPPGPVDFLLFMLGGFPILLALPYPTYDGFRRSYLPRRYWDVARGGIARIYLGLLKFACVYLVVAYVLRSRFVSLDYASAGASSLKVWGAGAVRLFLMFMSLVGKNQLEFGVGRLFGYELDDFYVHPWFAWSPLDYWRRDATWNVRYLKKYVYFPLLFRFPGFFWPLVATYSTTSFFNVLYAASPPTGRDLPAAMLATFAPFAVVSAAEIAWRNRRGQPSAVSPPTGWKRVAATAGMLVLLVLLHAPQPPLFNLARAPAGAPALTFAQRYRLLYGKLLFLE